MKWNTAANFDNQITVILLPFISASAACFDEGALINRRWEAARGRAQKHDERSGMEDRRNEKPKEWLKTSKQMTSTSKIGEKKLGFSAV